MTPRLTAAEAKLLGRRQEQPTRRPGELLAVWVPGRLMNPLNASAWIWQKRVRYAKAWKERVALALLDPPWSMYDRVATPKVVYIRASLWNYMDGDGLQAACKPIRDALVECGVVSGDAERDEHTWSYAQVIDRARRGVEVRVQLREVTP